MESWRKVFRDGFAPLVSDAGLDALLQGLRIDAPQLIQGATTTPPPLACVQDWEPEGACLVGYCGWQGDGLTTVGEVEEYFACMCYEIDKRVGEAAGCRHLLNWWDDTPRDEARRELIAECEREVHRRWQQQGEAGA